MGIIDRTKEAKDAAASKVGQLKDAATSKATELRDQTAAKMADVMEGMVAKLKETLADFDAALPIVRSGGYALAEASVEIGLVPKIVASFVVEQAAPAERIAEIAAAHADKKLAVALLKTLSQARRLQESVSIRGLKPKGISVEVGLLPTVVIKFA